jgi:small subunit ribosomal protein S20
MANTKQAKKRAGQSIKRRDRNRSVKSATKTVLKESRAAVAEPSKAKAAISTTASTLDVAVRKGVLHKKTASRLKSRIAKSANKAAKK